MVASFAGVLAQPDFRRIFASQSLSTLGDAAATIAVTFAVLDMGGSATALGAVLAARYLPLAALLLVGGVFADRVQAQRLMLASETVRAAVQATLAALLLSGTAQLWQIVVLTGIHGTAEAFFAPALTGVVPDVVPADDRQQANALIRMTYDLSIIAGPAIGGLLVTAIGSGGAVAADAATFVLSALLIAGVRPVRRAAAPRQRIRVLRDLKEGWSEVRSRTWLWVSILNFTVFSALAMPATLVLGPDYVHSELGGVAAWSLLMTAFGAGSLAGSIVSLRLRLPWPGVAMAVLLALGAARPALFASGLALPAIAACCFVAGAATSTAGILWVGLLQQHVPAGSLSRVDSIDGFGTYLLSPVGYAIAGPIALWVGLGPSMLLLAGIPLVASLGTLLCSQLRRLGWDAAPRPAPEDRERPVPLAAEPAVPPQAAA